MMQRIPALLDSRHLLLLHATLGDDQTAIRAYSKWRASGALDDIDDTTYRILPMLSETAKKAGLQDSEDQRIRGAVKHIWLSNMLRIGELVAAKTALDNAEIKSLLIKGGALFARAEQAAAMRAAGDYDLQVHRRDASRAVRALMQSSFQAIGMRLDLFSESDFDRNIHAVAMTRTRANVALDLHWRPLTRIYHEEFVEGLFANAERAELFGQKVLIPGLADHLFLAVARPEPWDTKETLLRAIEITQLLRSCSGQMDWDRFEELIARYGMGWIAGPLLNLVRREVGAPVPEHLTERIWRDAMPGKTLEFSCRSVRPTRRGPWQRFLLAVLESLRSQRPRRFSLRHLIVNPSLLSKAFFAGEQELPFLKNVMFKRLWARCAGNGLPVNEISFVRGFSIPEQDGRWTDAEFAVIEIAVENPKHATVTTEFKVIPFLPSSESSFKFDVYSGAGGPRHYVLTPSDPMPFRLTVDAPVVGTGAARKVVMAFRMFDLRRPNEIGHSIDHRLLGLFFEGFQSGRSPMV